MAQVFDEQLAEGMVLHQFDGLLKDAREPVLPGLHVQFHDAPRAPREERDLFAQRGGAPAQGNEGDPQASSRAKLV